MPEETVPEDETPPFDQTTAETNEQAAPQQEAVSESDQFREKIIELQKSADALKDQFLRKAAEFENYKRRVEADSQNLVRYANESLISSLLPILNDFIRSLKHGQERKDYDSFYKGVELIYNKFSKILEVQGLVSIESEGKPFNVDYHDALLQIPKDDVPPHTVIEEVERGYKLNDKVIRHAKVIVSSAPEPPVAKSEPEPVLKNGDTKEPAD